MRERKATRSRPGRKRGFLLHYKFETAEGTTERGRLEVKNRRDASVGDRLPIEYRGSQPAFSRLQGTNNSGWVKAFVGSSVAMVLLVVVMSIQSLLEERYAKQR